MVTWRQSRIRWCVTGRSQKGHHRVGSWVFTRCMCLSKLLIGPWAHTPARCFFCTPSTGHAKLCCVWLYCVSGASWALVSQRVLWAMQINLFLTDVPCIFHIRAVQEMSKKFPPPHTDSQCRSASPSPHPLPSPPAHLPLCAPFQPLSLKSMELILVGLMDFAAKVRRMHFNHGRS